MSLQPLKASDYIVTTDFTKFFVCGDFGTGKSEFAASFPTPGFVLNFDRKIATYARYDGWDYLEWPISPEGWVKFEKDEKEILTACNEGHYKTVVYDSTTAMGDIAMARAMQLDPKRSETNGPIWNVHFAMVRNLMEGHFRAMMNVKANLVVIAHLNIERDQKTGAIIGIEPLLTGQLSVRVPGYFEEVYCAFTRPKEGGNTEWYLRTIPLGYYKARSTMSGRASLLPKELPNTYSAVVKAYHDAIANQKRKVDEIMAIRAAQLAAKEQEKGKETPNE